jgi:predicted N-acetyltransferase YhbS
MAVMEIRQVTAEERLETMFPLQQYAFSPSPWDEAAAERYRSFTPYNAGTVSLVAEEGGEALAGVAALPMRQNLRGTVLPMAGIASVASHPSARRRGLVRALLDQLLRQMADSGHALSALYPFRPSFYERFGFVGLPRPREVGFAPAGLAHLVRAELPGTVTRQHIRDGYEDYRAFTLRMLRERHGFSVFPDYRAVSVRDTLPRWVAIARVDGEVVGAVTYRIERHGGDLVADDMLTTGPLGRALLLQFFARHVDQVSRVLVSVGVDDPAELWATDLTVTTQARVSHPEAVAPMARVLSLEALAGVAAGPGGVTVEVAGDELLNGRYRLEGVDGRLVVQRGVSGAVGATLSAAGLSGLLYGVLDPVDVVVRGFGEADADATAALRSLFPRDLPYLYADF